MTANWEDVNARARGLGSHLMSVERIEALGASPDLRSLADALRAAGLSVPDDAVNPAELELAVRRDASGYIGTLHRWCDGRSDALALVLEDEDRRSLRTMLRGAAEGAPHERRVAGLVPTPSLPVAALDELARQPTIAAFAALLVAWRHPYGPPLLPEAAGAHPDLARLERALNRTFAARALRLARRAGRRGPLVEQARLMIDLDNAQCAIALASGDRSVTPGDLFLKGGARLAIDVFERASASTATAAAQLLATSFHSTPFEAVLRDTPASGSSLEERLLSARIAALSAARRLDPLGPQTVLAFLLRVRLQLVALRRVIWRTALQAGQPSPAAAA